MIDLYTNFHFPWLFASGMPLSQYRENILTALRNPTGLIASLPYQVNFV